VTTNDMTDIGVQASLSDLDSNCFVTKCNQRCRGVLSIDNVFSNSMLRLLHYSSESGCIAIGMPFDDSNLVDDAYSLVSNHAEVEAARAILKIHKSESRKERKQS